MEGFYFEDTYGLRYKLLVTETSTTIQYKSTTWYYSTMPWAKFQQIWYNKDPQKVLLPLFLKKLRVSKKIDIHLDSSLAKLQISNKFLYGIKNIEHLAQSISDNVVVKENSYDVVVNQINDQKVAQSNEYCDIAMRLLQLMNQFYAANGLQKLEEIYQKLHVNEEQIPIKLGNDNKYSQKIDTNKLNQIADIQFNFDQTIIAARFTEPQNILEFWKIDKQNEWKSCSTGQCHSKSLINFQFSKKKNEIITCGVDSKREFTIFDHQDEPQQSSSVKLWYFNEKGKFTKISKIRKSASRLQSMAFNNSENLIAIGEGGTLNILEKNMNETNLQQSKQISSEIITALSFNYNDNIIAVGAMDQKITLWKYSNQKLTIQQQVIISTTPKQLIFSNFQNELYINTKDGRTMIYSENQQGELIQAQMIVINDYKISSIALNSDSSILAIGNEANVIQLWCKINKQQWQRCQSIQQDDYIGAISFGNTQRLIVASNNTDYYVHYQYY